MIKMEQIRDSIGYFVVACRFEFAISKATSSMEPQDTLPSKTIKKKVTIVSRSKLAMNKKKIFLFFSPTQLAIQGQWWS